MAKLAALKRRKADKSFAGIVAWLAEGLEARGQGAAAPDFCRHSGILS